MGAFEIVEVGSPRPVLDVLLTVSHEGKVTQVDIEVPGARTYVEADMQGSSDEIDVRQAARPEHDADVVLRTEGARTRP